ncbi:MAG TPA: hypothetical protein VN133_11620 [Humibacter sp.]|nr:hypothetical protein [Humibacter sp.]
MATFATLSGQAGVNVLLMLGACGGLVGAAFLTLLGRISTEWAMAGPFTFARGAR